MLQNYPKILKKSFLGTKCIVICLACSNIQPHNGVLPVPCFLKKAFITSYLLYLIIFESNWTLPKLCFYVFNKTFHGIHKSLAPFISADMYIRQLTNANVNIVTVLCLQKRRNTTEACRIDVNIANIT